MRLSSDKGFLTFWLLAALLMLLPAPPAAAQNCAKLSETLQGRQAWQSLPCERLKQSYLLPIRELPELPKLCLYPLEDTTELLGLPFHIYNHEGRTICFFRPEAFISIAYNEKTEMPDIISFDFTGVVSAEEIPAKLGLNNIFPPTITERSLVWEDLGPFTKVEINHPDLRINGENVFEVSLHLPPADPPVKKDKDEGRSGRKRR